MSVICTDSETDANGQAVMSADNNSNAPLAELMHRQMAQIGFILQTVQVSVQDQGSGKTS